MRYYSVFVMCFAVVLFSSSLVFSEEAKCEKCHGKGKLEDPDKDKVCKHTCMCTYCYEDYASHGFGFLLCPKCKGAQEEYDQLEKQYQDWLVTRRDRIDKIVWGTKWEENKIHHIASEHYAISGRLRKAKVRINKKYVVKTPCERAHIMLDRAEHSYITYMLPSVGDLKYKPEEKWEMSIWANNKELLHAANRLVGVTQAGTSTYRAKLLTMEDIGTDEDFHQALIFTLSLLFIEEYKGFVEGGLPDWFSEGFAHYVEYAEFGNIVNNCSDEGSSSTGLTGKNLRNKAKLMAKKGKYPLLDDFGDKNVADLTPDDRLIAWSIIDWVIQAYGAKKLALFVKVLKRTKNQGAAFRDAFGFGYTEVMDEWKSWVIENY